MLIGIALVTTTAIGSIALYKSYAIYKEEKNYNVIQGIIPDFDYDVKVAIQVDEEEDVEKIPSRGDHDEEGHYYKADVNCYDGETPINGEWDYNAWNLKIDNVTQGTKCKLTFTSDLTGEEYKKYIEEGVEHRRNTYRGKDLSSYFEDDTSKTKFYNQIKDGTFDDIYVGDYIVDENAPTIEYDDTSSDNLGNPKGKKVTWLIADIDNYLYTGPFGDIITKHHVTIIPATPLIKDQMNGTAITTGGYAGSDMVKIEFDQSNGRASEEQIENGKLDGIYNKYINCDGCSFKDYVLPYHNYLSNKVDDKATNNRFGNLNVLGTSSNANWYPRKLDLMSEMNVYGSTFFSSSGWDTEMDNKQYALFRLKPEFINSYGNMRFNYWLKDVVSNQHFADVDTSGVSFERLANSNDGVRPRFLVYGGESN